MKFLIALLPAMLLGAADPQVELPSYSVHAGGKVMNLLLPEKTCAYDRSHAADAKILDGIEKANPESQLLIAFIDCGNLSAIRGEKDAAYGPGYYGQMLSDIAGQTVADNYTREDYVKAVAVQYGLEPPERAMERGEARLRELAAGTNEMPPETIGIIRKSPDYLQIAVIGSQKGPTGELQKNLNIITLTKLGVPVSITIGHPLTPGMTLRDMSDRVEIYMRQVILINPEELPPFFKGIDKWSFLLGLGVGIAAMLIIGFIRRGHH